MEPQNGQELISKFGDLSTSGFFEPVILQDTAVGFSIKKNYPEKILYKPAIGQKSGLPDDCVIIRMSLIRHKKQSEITPLEINISTISKYKARTQKWDYHFEDISEDCPSEESLKISLSTPQPLEVVYKNNYFYNNQLDQFQDKGGNKLCGLDILNKAFKDHCKTVSYIFILHMRLNNKLQSFFYYVLSAIIKFCKLILRMVFGRGLITSSDMIDKMVGTLRSYPWESLKRLEEETITISGYKVSKNVGMIFCLIIVVYFVFLNKLTDSYFSSIQNKPYIVFAVGMIIVWILDVPIPRLIFLLMNFFIVLRKKISSLKMIIR
jgi:hypothetical protein